MICPSVLHNNTKKVAASHLNSGWTRSRTHTESGGKLSLDDEWTTRRRRDRASERAKEGAATFWRHWLLRPFDTRSPKKEDGRWGKREMPTRAIELAEEGESH